MSHWPIHFRPVWTQGMEIIRAALTPDAIRLFVIEEAMRRVEEERAERRKRGDYQ